MRLRLHTLMLLAVMLGGLELQLPAIALLQLRVAARRPAASQAVGRAPSSSSSSNNKGRESGVARIALDKQQQRQQPKMPSHLLGRSSLMY